MVGQKDGYAGFPQGANLVLEPFDSYGIDSAEGLVQQDKGGIGDKATGDF